MTEPRGPSGLPSEPDRRHPHADALVELALGVAPAPAELSAHLRGCAECRAAYDDIARDLEVALAATPAIEAPAGFESRVLSRLATEPTPLPRRSGRRLVSLAVAAAVGVLVGVAGLLGVQALTTDAPPSDAMALRTAEGELVGRVHESWVGDEEVLVLRILDGPPGVHYECRLRLDDDTTKPAGEWVVPDSGTATWITRSSPRATRIELLTDSGKVWSSASLG